MHEDGVTLGEDVVHGLREIVHGAVLEDAVHDVVFEREALVRRERQPFLLNQQRDTFTAYSRSTRMKNFVSSLVHS